MGIPHVYSLKGSSILTIACLYVFIPSFSWLHVSMAAEHAILARI